VAAEAMIAHGVSEQGTAGKLTPEMRDAILSATSSLDFSA
jgi:hypothetical protein